MVVEEQVADGEGGGGPARDLERRAAGSWRQGPERSPRDCTSQTEPHASAPISADQRLAAAVMERLGDAG
ncbi:hypothetical protein AB0M32_35045 [Streptomyces sp. NPDC051985]|uniref:hypothetical protein n=1 Tax=Streptomyces sp. NPDC051985 TaxID=3155807 RepID=UPI0034286F49